MGIYVSFFVFIILFTVNLFVPVSGNMTHTNRMWLVLDAYVLIISIALLIKMKLPSRKRIVLSLFLGALMFLAYQGIYFSSVKGFITTSICSLASFRVFEQYPAHAVAMVKASHLNPSRLKSSRLNPSSLKSAAISLLLALAVGVVWGIVNLGISGQPLNFDLNLSCFLTALSPAVLEEVCYRLLLFAFCLFLLNGEIRSKKENFLCYFMMIIPHVLIHLPDIFLSYGLISGIVNMLLMSLIFGLPFALLQRNRDLLSAMTAHGVVDIIRFAFLGLPF